MNRIAIIGSGIAGLTFAWLARRAGIKVTLFESEPRLGMDAHSINLPVVADGRAPGSLRVDVPPRMFNREDWPRLTALYETLGVVSQPVDASKSFSTHARSGWLKLGDQYRGGFTAASLLSSKVRRVAAEMTRMQAAVTEATIDSFPHELTLGQYLKQEQYGDEFVYDFLFPGLAATVLTCSYKALENYPAKIALQSLLNQVDRSPLRRTTHGTTDVVSRLSKDIDDIRLSTRVASVHQTKDGVSVVCDGGSESTFDRLVVATQANSAARLLDCDPTLRSAQKVLSAFKYENVSVVVHRDDSLLPKGQSHWRCFNFISQDDRSDAMCTIWLNRFYPEWSQAGGQSENVFQTIRPTRMPAKEKTITVSAMQRPIVSTESIAAVNQLRNWQADEGSERRVRFVGSYVAESVPLLESGVSSAHEAAQAMGIGSSASRAVGGMA